jgi:hypothetical protein
MYPETPSEGDVPPEELPFAPPVFNVTLNDNSISDGDSQVLENVRPSRQSRASHQAQGVTPVETPVTAGTSQRGWVCMMSRRMAELIAQGMHHVARQSTMGETDKDLFHDAHLDLQERMRNPIAFHAEMMGYLVSSTSTLTARCKGIHASCSQGSQRTCGFQQLDTQETK